MKDTNAAGYIVLILVILIPALFVVIAVDSTVNAPDINAKCKEQCAIRNYQFEEYYSGNGFREGYCNCKNQQGEILTIYKR